MLLPSEQAAAQGSARPRPGTAARYRRVGGLVALTDAAAVDLAVVLVRLMRFGVHPVGLSFGILLVAVPVVWLAIFYAFQLYAIARLSPAEEFRRILEASGVAIAVKLLVSLVVHDGRGTTLSGGWLALTGAVALALAMIDRQLWHKHLGRLRLSGQLLYRTLIVGANEEAVRLAESLHDPSLGFEPVGLVRTDFGWVAWDGLPILGSVHEVSRLIEHEGIECVFVASSAVGPDLMKRIAKELRRQSVEIRVSANLTQILSSRLSVQPVGDLLALSLKPVRLSGPQAALKRTFDLAVGSVVVLVTTPIWLVLGAMVKFTSRGPVLFRQVRVGQGAKPFTVYKFRTMVAGAEELLAQLQDRNEASGPLFKMKKDPRVTRVGRFLRKWSLDELPQLINVLRGEMSLVGPRPALPAEVAAYEDWHRDRLEVPPGITGLWQVGGRSDLSGDEYFRLDIFYIENWSIAYDLFIIMKTIPAVLFRKGAF